MNISCEYEDPSLKTKGVDKFQNVSPFRGHNPIWGPKPKKQTHQSFTLAMPTIAAKLQPDPMKTEVLPIFGSKILNLGALNQNSQNPASRGSEIR